MTSFAPRPPGMTYAQYVAYINEAYMRIRRKNKMTESSDATPLKGERPPMDMASEPPIYPEDHEQEMGGDAEPAKKEPPQ